MNNAEEGHQIMKIKVDSVEEFLSRYRFRVIVEERGGEQKEQWLSVQWSLLLLLLLHLFHIPLNHRPENIELRKEKQDDMLHDLSNVLGDLKGMASDMQSVLHGIWT
ncbi:hypothetical protein QVD17_11883 [Tagetes erecta]|uniref:Uncharacterized protein n=1 Tax=Tagetes erecta TaxID=13708 RepID=A0AAD8KFB6_TARER|nr:hypothetical protein QVD17_27787 [Tagetes erecta]KAK1420261.1 hypothetical protein QVD17_21706 [Tagetes erecta]KAK1429669.1 hypothetical protein QVD17_11883 [Tagetes erecta]